MQELDSTIITHLAGNQHNIHSYTSWSSNVAHKLIACAHTHTRERHALERIPISRDVHAVVHRWGVLYLNDVYMTCKILLLDIYALHVVTYSPYCECDWCVCVLMMKVWRDRMRHEFIYCVFPMLTQKMLQMLTNTTKGRDLRHNSLVVNFGKCCKKGPNGHQCWGCKIFYVITLS